MHGYHAGRRRPIAPAARSRILPITALAIAGCLLALQVLAAIEYTRGGTLYTTASMIAAMVTLAALPVFVEAARRARHYGLALSLGVAFLAFLAYSLPATTGRTGEIKEAKVLAADDAGRLASDIEAADRSHWQISAEKATECRDAPSPLPPAGWPKCRRLIGELEAINERLAKLKGEQADTKTDRLGDMGSDLWAWALSPLGATPERVRKVSIIAFATGVDVAIWALVAFAVSALANRAPNTVRTVFAASDTDTAAVLAALQGAGRALTNDELATAMGVQKSEGSKRAKNAEASGAIVRWRDGKTMLHAPAR